MDDSAHARYTQEEFYAHLEAIESRQIKKVSTHSLVSAPNTRVLCIFIRWLFLEWWNSFTAGHLCNICLYSFRAA